MAKRPAPPLLIKSVQLYRSKPKTFIQELFGLNSDQEECGRKDFYSNGKVIETFTKIKPHRDGYREDIIGSEVYYLGNRELNELLDQQKKVKQANIDEIKNNILK